ncbi:MAG: ATP-dependent Clp protease ATP-binding subunit [Patescibacteria group bacterium]|nr:ATP-dependent Clp protease ATP-binding subunit [Patescibacteria group bacterium]
MLGNLFTSKKYPQDSNNQVPAAGQIPVSVPVDQNISGQQGKDEIIGSSMKPVVRQDLSILSHLDTRAAAVLNQAEKETKRIRQEFIEPEQLLIGLIFDGDIFQLLGKFSIDVAALAKELQAKEQMGTFEGNSTLSDTSKQIFEKAYSMVKERGVEFISPEDLLVALFEQNVTVAELLKSQGLEKEKIEAELEKSSSFVYGKKSALEEYGIDLTEEAKNGELDPISGRDREVERVVHILLRRTKNNPVIIGEAGVGKTAIVEGLAQELVSGKAPKDLQSKKIIQLDLSSMIAGASHRGEFEERLRRVIKETQTTGNVILFIDEIHTLIGAGDTEGALDASNIIKPFLARGQLQLIGTTTTMEYRKHFEKDKAFERRFQPVVVEEPSEEAAIGMLNVIKPKYENFHKVVITPEAISSSVKLSKRYIGERYLPDKAVDLLDEAAAQVRLEQNEGKRQDNQIREEDIQKVVSSWTGIPITKLTENESEKLLHLEESIHKRLIDQEAAVSTVAEAVRRGRIGLSNANRPIASFIFLGPTGVGKTELAKTLASILFGKEEAMVRLDMSEYMEKHEVAKLIGAPPGYVGYEEGGQLTEAVRIKPYSIVLLDEIEKAHPDVFNILLQLLEDGRLTDNKGNTISFKNTIVIATSNIGSALIQQQLSQNLIDEQKTGVKNEELEKKKFDDLSKILVGELRRFFKPELLNRFDGVIIFEPLAQKDMMAVAKLGVEATRKLLLAQEIDLEISEDGLAQLAKEGYDPQYGARPLRRLIQTGIENPIAVLIINKTFIKGDKIIVGFDAKKDEFTFTKSVQVAPQEVVPDKEIPENTNGESPAIGQNPNKPQASAITPDEQGTQMKPNESDSSVLV